MLVLSVSYVSCCMTTDDDAIIEIRELDSFLLISCAEDMFTGTILYLVAAIMLTSNCHNTHAEENIPDTYVVERVSLLVNDCVAMYQIPQKYFIVFWGTLNTVLVVITGKIITSEKYGRFDLAGQQPATAVSEEEEVTSQLDSEVMKINSSDMIKVKSSDGIGGDE